MIRTLGALTMGAALAAVACGGEFAPNTWGVKCNIAQKARFGGSCLSALRIDRKTLKLEELK